MSTPSGVLELWGLFGEWGHAFQLVFLDNDAFQLVACSSFFLFVRVVFRFILLVDVVRVF
jgi:hypothetical protein